MFCENCGTKNKNGAKFCTNCGKKIKEKIDKETIESKSTNTIQLWTECIEIVKSFLVKPIDTLKENVKEEKFNSALVMILINAVTFALFTIILVGELSDSVMYLMGYSSLMPFGPSIVVEIPYFKVFVMTCIIAILTIVLIIVGCYLISNKLFKSNTSIKKMTTLFGFSSIIVTIGLLIASILALINIKLSFIIIGAVSLLNCYYNYKGLEFACDADVNKLGYVLMPSVMITLGIVIYILPKVLL